MDELKIGLHEAKAIAFKLSELHDDIEHLMNHIIELEVFMHGKFKLDGDDKCSGE